MWNMTGIPSAFQTVEELIKFITMVIFTVTAQHNAVHKGQVRWWNVSSKHHTHNGCTHLKDINAPSIVISIWSAFQYDYNSWTPNNPLLMRKPPPSTKGLSSMKTILETLPNIGETVSFMSIGWLLTQSYSDSVSMEIWIITLDELINKLINLHLCVCVSGVHWHVPRGTLWWGRPQTDDQGSQKEAVRSKRRNTDQELKTSGALRVLGPRWHWGQHHRVKDNISSIRFTFNWGFCCCCVFL